MQHPHYGEVVFVLYFYSLGGVKTLSNIFQVGLGFYYYEKVID